MLKYIYNQVLFWQIVWNQKFRYLFLKCSFDIIPIKLHLEHFDMEMYAIIFFLHE